MHKETKEKQNYSSSCYKNWGREKVHLHFATAHLSFLLHLFFIQASCTHYTFFCALLNVHLRLKNDRRERAFIIILQKQQRTNLLPFSPPFFECAWLQKRDESFCCSCIKILSCACKSVVWSLRKNFGNEAGCTVEFFPCNHVIPKHLVFNASLKKLPKLWWTLDVFT